MELAKMCQGWDEGMSGKKSSELRTMGRGPEGEEREPRRMVGCMAMPTGGKELVQGNLLQ